jgi:hypothetical protein
MIDIEKKEKAQKSPKRAVFAWIKHVKHVKTSADVFFLAKSKAESKLLRASACQRMSVG